jgi:hypothetical protein
VTSILLSPPDVGELDIDAFDREVAVSPGTAALHATLVSRGVARGDVVPVSTFTFAATVNAISHVAEPHFADCEITTGNISPALELDVQPLVLLQVFDDRVRIPGRMLPLAPAISGRTGFLDEQLPVMLSLLGGLGAYDVI